MNLTRREFLRAGAVVGGMMNICLPSLGEKRSGAVYVVTFSNFEGHCQDADAAIRWFEACTKAHPNLAWTHMYSPRYFVKESAVLEKAESKFTPYLSELRRKGHVEVGLHMHMFYDVVRQAHVIPLAYPFAGDKSVNCDQTRSPEEDPTHGYDVLMTGYSSEDRSRLLDSAIDLFVRHGLGRPKAFCAGYSAADPQLQALLARKRFSVSFAAQVVEPNQYGGCWDHFSRWSERITPLSMPYRVSRRSILPSPHEDARYLDLVEFPLNMGVDRFDLYLSQKLVSRSAMFDRHLGWARKSGLETAVAIGMHADAVALEEWGAGPISHVVNDFLTHVERSMEAGERVRFGTVSNVAKRFRGNTTIGDVGSPAP